MYDPPGQTKMENAVLSEVGAKYGKTPAQVLGRWCVQMGIPYVPKSTKKHRMIENAQVFDFALSAEDMQKLDELTTQENFETMKKQYEKSVCRDTPLQESREGMKTNITID